jgi:hypothetical protein
LNAEKSGRKPKICRSLEPLSLSLLPFTICAVPSMEDDCDIIIPHIFTGDDDEVVLRNATHVTVDKSVKVIPERAFHRHPNAVVVDCRNAERIEREAFCGCPSLERVKMPGVKAVEKWAFEDCEALKNRIRCIQNLRIFDGRLPAICQIVEADAFDGCEDLTDVKFGDKLETIEDWAFYDCPSLERITIPLKNGKDIFKGCENLE